MSDASEKGVCQAISEPLSCYTGRLLLKVYSPLFSNNIVRKHVSCHYGIVIANLYYTLEWH